ncbi:MAG: hypothetical protein ABIF82_07215 [Planctomycetota bacterium]
MRKLIHGWDPYRLLEIGAPEDEWNREILQIVARADQIKSATDATRVISEAFTSAFQREGFGEDDCAEVGNRLFNALKDAGLIQIAEQTGGG